MIKIWEKYYGKMEEIRKMILEIKTEKEQLRAENQAKEQHRQAENEPIKQ